MGGATGPAEPIIKDPGILQRGDHGVVGAMNIGDGDDALDAAVLPLAGAGRQGQRARQEKRD